MENVSEYSGMEFSESENSVKLVKGTDRDTVEIPAIVNGKPVMSIGPDAFKGMGMLKSVEIPGTVRQIDHNAFAYCTNLEEVRFAEGLEVINNYAFLMCTSLKETVLPDTTVSIGIWAFAYCRNLRTVSVPSRTKLGIACFTDSFLDAEDNRIELKEIPGHVFEKDDGSDCFHAAGERRGSYSDSIPVISIAEAYDPKNPLYSKFKPVLSTGVTFDDIAGLEHVKEAVREQIVIPFERPDLYRRFGLESGGGILLYGPPGTGKTMIAQAVASEVNAAFFSVKGSDLISKYVGESEQNIKRLFAAARSLPVSVIFFDEFEVIGKARGNDLEPWADKMLSELLAQMQGFEKNNNAMLVLAATNMPWTLDSALLRPGRFGRKIYVPLPDTEAREQIIRKCLKNLPTEELDYRNLADATEGFNAADVKEFCDRMKLSAVKRSLASGEDEFIGMGDAEYAEKSVKTSADPRDIARMELFSQS